MPRFVAASIRLSVLPQLKAPPLPCVAFQEISSRTAWTLPAASSFRSLELSAVGVETP